MPMMDASGEASLRTFLDRCRKKGVFVILSNVQAQPKRLLSRMGLLEEEGAAFVLAVDYQDALSMMQKRLSL